MKIGTKYFDISFVADTAKEAYLKACKWLANYIINDKVLSESVYKFIKVREDAFETEFRLEVYCVVDSTDIQKRFCAVCKEFHSAFYVNFNYDCNKCNMSAFRDRLNEAIAVKKTYLKNNLKNKKRK